MSTQTLHQPVSIDAFVTGLRKFPEAAFDSTAGILDYLARTPVDPASLERYLSWNAQHYTRNLIDRTPLYELMAICWEIGQVSSVHNHRDQNCWMAVPIGRLAVQNFHTISQDLVLGSCDLEPTDCVEMNPAHPCAVNPQDPVHRVVNSRDFNQRAVSLHVYSRPFDSCIVYSPEQHTCGEIRLHFNTLYGKPAQP
jgi:cysteine dioxygenase